MADAVYRLPGISTSRAWCVALQMVLCLGSLVSVHAQTSDVAVRLTRIRADVSAAERKIDGLKEEFRKLKKDETHLEDEIRRLAQEEQAMLNQSTQALRRKEKLLVDLKAAELRVVQQQALIRQRLRILYMNSSVNERSIVLGAAHSGQVERVAVYASALRRYDDARFRDVTRAVEGLLATRRLLDTALDEAKALQEGIQSKRAELETQKGLLREVIQQIQVRQQAAKRSLDALTSEAEKLEALLRVIMSAEGGDRRDSVEDATSTSGVSTPGPKPLEQRERGGGATSLGIEKGASASDVMHPGGLFAQTARLVYPVAGEVVQRFGANKVTSFADMVFSKGLEYKTPEGSQVKAVLGGRVAFAGVMPGYDTVVIIDHGERSYSLYGRLGKAHVKQGDLVQRRDVIGVTSAADSKGRNFYFETRKNGSPVDPGAVLSRAARAS
jgi:septal ring factor EnvC (AmiA/AmiB activator)